MGAIYSKDLFNFKETLEALGIQYTSEIKLLSNPEFQYAGPTRIVRLNSDLGPTDLVAEYYFQDDGSFLGHGIRNISE